MNENVARFFAIYDSDPALRQRLKDAEDSYPGSLEIRESVVTDVLLPVAEEMGLPFTVRDLNIYEALKFNERHPDREMTPEELDSDDDDYYYWLNGRGWSYDTNLFKKGNE